MATKLECAAKDIMDIFKKYAKNGGQSDALELNELKELFRKEMKMFSPETFDKLAETMIQCDATNNIDFSEYLKMLFALTTCKDSLGCQSSKGKSQQCNQGQQSH